VGDAVLRAVAHEAQRQVRLCDVLARWGGEDLVLMMGDTRAALARGGLERLLQRVAALRILNGTAALGVTMSAGLAEHRAGESVDRRWSAPPRPCARPRPRGRATWWWRLDAAGRL
jgi:diguanylate cyclase (GGDEF)-like protein